MWEGNIRFPVEGRARNVARNWKEGHRGRKGLSGSKFRELKEGSDIDQTNFKMYGKCL